MTDELDLESLLEKVISIGQQTSRYLKTEFEKQNYSISTKHDASIVTSADLKAHQLIKEGLQSISHYPVVSEEELISTIPTGPYWLIDPLDGTSSFVKNIPELAVNIALINEEESILGVVCDPMQDRFFAAIKNKGAFCGNEKTRSKIRSRKANHDQLTVLTSRIREDLKDRIQEVFPSATIKAQGGALKFCLIAKGEADLFFKRGETHIWDTAAPQCILEEAGGALLTWNLEPLSYDCKKIKNPHFIAIGDVNYPLSGLLENLSNS